MQRCCLLPWRRLATPSNAPPTARASDSNIKTRQTPAATLHVPSCLRFRYRSAERVKYLTKMRFNPSRNPREKHPVMNCLLNVPSKNCSLISFTGIHLRRLCIREVLDFGRVKIPKAVPAYYSSGTKLFSVHKVAYFEHHACILFDKV